MSNELNKVFISGSISLKSLPNDAIHHLWGYIVCKYHILVGDANGIDRLIQQYFIDNKYCNVTIYSIHTKPRNIMSKLFHVKHIDYKTSQYYLNSPDNIKRSIDNSYRLQQTAKDIAMSNDSTESYMIWDGNSKGTLANINRAKSQNKDYTLVRA